MPGLQALAHPASGFRYRLTFKVTFDTNQGTENSCAANLNLVANSTSKPFSAITSSTYENGIEIHQK